MRFVVPIITQTGCAGFLSLAVISFPSPSLAVSVEQVPNPRQDNGGWVTDMADVLSPSTEAELNRMISELEAKNDSEIAVVTVPETAAAKTPKQFTTALFNHWKIGKADRDNGVLFLISKGDRRVEIETGYGVETILPDARVGNIIQQEITPRLKQGDYNGGTLAGTKALVTALQGEAHNSNALTPTPSADRQTSKTPSADTQTTSAEPLTDSSDTPGSPVGVLVLAGLGMLIGLVVRLARGDRDDDDNGNSGRRRHRRSTSTGSTSMSSTNTGSTSTGSTSTGSTSTGGSSFGGGSSGGGGAGGSY